MKMVFNIHTINRNSSAVEKDTEEV